MLEVFRVIPHSNIRQGNNHCMWIVFNSFNSALLFSSIHWHHSKSPF